MHRYALPLIMLIGLLAIAPSRLHSQDEEAELNDRISIGAIAVDDGWGRPLRSPSSLFLDEQAGELFVTDQGNNRVLIYDRMLQPKFSFVHYVKDRTSDRIVKGEPRAIVVTSRGDIVLLDNYVDYVEVLDFRGFPLERIYPNKLLGDTTLSIKPQCVAIDSRDNLYIGTAGDLVGIIVVDDHMQFKRVIGDDQTGDGKLQTMLTIQTWRDTLLVTDLYAEPAIKIFDTLGNYIRGFGGHDIEEADVSFPSGITAYYDTKTDQELMWVTDGLRQVVKVYHGDGSFLGYVGGFGLGPGEFRYPASIAASGDSVLYICERVGNRLQKFVIH